MCRSAVKGTILDGGSRPCAETLRLALGCGATGRAAAPAQGEPCDLLPSETNTNGEDYERKLTSLDTDLREYSK